MRAMGMALLGIGVLAALVAIGTRTAQAPAAILALIGGALIAASWLVLVPPGPKTGVPASPA